MGQYWTFKIFTNLNGESDIKNWKDELPVRLRIRIDRIVVHLEAQKDMRCGYFKSYKGHDNIYELRFTHNNIQYRPLGCFGPEANEFTLLVPAIEKGSRLKPKKSLSIAEKRRDLILQNRGYTDDYV